MSIWNLEDKEMHRPAHFVNRAKDDKNRQIIDYSAHTHAYTHAYTRPPRLSPKLIEKALKMRRGVQRMAQVGLIPVSLRVTLRAFRCELRGLMPVMTPHLCIFWSLFLFIHPCLCAHFVKIHFL